MTSLLCAKFCCKNATTVWLEKTFLFKMAQEQQRPLQTVEEEILNQRASLARYEDILHQQGREFEDGLLELITARIERIESAIEELLAEARTPLWAEVRLAEVRRLVRLLTAEMLAVHNLHQNILGYNDSSDSSDSSGREEDQDPPAEAQADPVGGQSG